MIATVCSQFPFLNFLYGLIGILGLLIAYVLLMTLYGKFRKIAARKGNKFAAELITLGIVVFIALFVNLVVIYSYAEETDTSPVAVFKALYQSIGSFAFEGLATTLNVANLDKTGFSYLLTSLFYGWPILTGLVFVSIVTAKANYELFSKIRVKLPFRRRENIYVFTALNDENMMIAEDLNRKEKHAMIVFSGPTLPAFDGKDELCRKVIKNNFFYYSYSDDSKKPIVKRLGLRIKRIKGSEHTDDSSQKTPRRIIVFSFDSENKIPREERNLSFAFDDAAVFLAYLNPQKNAKPESEVYTTDVYIEYYILSKREKNYQAYHGKVEALKEEYHYGTTFFPVGVTVWGEANAVADVTVEAIYDLLMPQRQDANEPLSPEERKEWERALCGECVRVWSLGYGANARAIVNNLYVQTTRMFPMENGFYKPNEFRASVFAPDVDTIGAFLAYESPFSIFLPGSTDSPLGTQPIPASILEEEIRQKKEKLNLSLKQKTTEMLKDAAGEPSTKAWAQSFLTNGEIPCSKWHGEEFSPLAACLYKESCVDFDFLPKLDAVTGKDAQKCPPQFLVIATGDDYQNIRLTNALVYDIMREGGGSGKQMIILNLRDERNATLIDSRYLQTEKRTQGAPDSTIKVGKDLIIVIVGTNRSLYSRRIIEYEKLSNYGCNYDRATNAYPGEGNRDQVQVALDAYYQGVDYSVPMKEAIRTISTIIDAQHDENPRTALKDWIKMEQWFKMSNQSARLFMPTFPRDDLKDNPKEAIRWLLTEHQRWMRLHFSHGWITGTKKKKEKVHNCLVPYNLVSPYTYKYDLVNVLWSDKSSATEAPPKGRKKKN